MVLLRGVGTAQVKAPQELLAGLLEMEKHINWFGDGLPRGLHLDPSLLFAFFPVVFQIFPPCVSKFISVVAVVVIVIIIMIIIIIITIVVVVVTIVIKCGQFRYSMLPHCSPSPPKKAHLLGF